MTKSKCCSMCGETSYNVSEGYTGKKYVQDYQCINPKCMHMESVTSRPPKCQTEYTVSNDKNRG